MLLFACYSSLAYSLYKCFEAMSCLNLSTGRLQKVEPVVNASTSSIGVWPVDGNTQYMQTLCPE